MEKDRLCSEEEPGRELSDDDGRGEATSFLVRDPGVVATVSGSSFTEDEGDSGGSEEPGEEGDVGEGVELDTAVEVCVERGLGREERTKLESSRPGMMRNDGVLL